ncbi:unnamed protein product, partial [Cladocopium goreaui]
INPLGHLGAALSSSIRLKLGLDHGGPGSGLDRLIRLILKHVPLNYKLRLFMLKPVRPNDKLRRLMLKRVAPNDKLKMLMLKRAPLNGKLGMLMLKHVPPNDKLKIFMLKRVALKDTLNRLTFKRVPLNDKLRRLMLKRVPPNDKLNMLMLKRAPPNGKLRMLMLKHVPPDDKLQIFMLKRVALNDTLLNMFMLKRVPLNDKLRKLMLKRVPRHDKLKIFMLKRASPNGKLNMLMLKRVPPNEELKIAMLKRGALNDQLKRLNMLILKRAPLKNELKICMLKRVALHDKLRRLMLKRVPLNDRLTMFTLKRVPRNDGEAVEMCEVIPYRKKRKASAERVQLGHAHEAVHQRLKSFEDCATGVHHADRVLQAHAILWRASQQTEAKADLKGINRQRIVRAGLNSKKKVCSSTVVFDQMASSAVSTKLNHLRADVVGKVVLELRIFGPTVMTNLPGRSGTTWSKCQCTALDGSGQTALLRRSFFGNDQGDQLKAWNAQYMDGSVFSFKGLKGAKADKRFSSCTSPVELEVTDKTVITPAESSNIPWRPAISFGIAEVLAKDSDGRVDLLGVCTNVTPLEQKTCKNKLGGEFQRSLCKVTLLDDSATDCVLTCWGECAEALVAKVRPKSVVAFYRVRLQVHSGGGKSLSISEDSYYIVLDKPDNISAREDNVIYKAQTFLDAGASQTATSYEGGADVSGTLRVVPVRALALAAGLTRQFEDAAWQVDVATWELEGVEDADQLCNRQGKLWAKVVLRDPSGEARLFAPEEALLGLTSCNDRDEFLKLFKEDALTKKRAQCRVHRSLRDGYANLHMLQGVPIFTLSTPAQKMYEDAAFSDASSCVPATLSSLSPNSCGGGLKINVMSRSF